MKRLMKWGSSERAFFRNIAVSVLGILLCVVSLCSASWAWFTEGVVSSSNRIQAARCDVSVTVWKDDEIVAPGENGDYELDAGAYTVELTAMGTGANAYALFTVGGQSYAAEISLSGEVGEREISLSFTKDTSMTIAPHWGTPEAGIPLLDDTGFSGAEGE